MVTLLEILRMLFSQRRRNSVRIPETVFLREILLFLLVFLMFLLSSHMIR